MSKRLGTYRLIAVFLWLGALSLMLFGISKVYGHYNTGSSKKDIFHVDAQYFEKARPAIQWLEDDLNIEGAMNPYLRKDIEQAYFQSIRSLNLSLDLQENVALEEHFTQGLLDKMLLDLNEKNGLIKQVNLTHTLSLHFLSFDKSVVSFTDVQSRIKRKVNGVVQDLILGYRVNMVLSDGRWRVDALETMQAEKFLPKFNETTIQQTDLMQKGINYYPSKTPWLDFWEAYSKEQTEQDFALIKELGYGMVRFFIPFEQFGGGLPEQEHLENLDHLVLSAEQNGLKLIPCLFDFPVGFELKKYPQYDRYLEAIMMRNRNKPAILLWDLKNEPDLDFEFQGLSATKEWLKFIIERARGYTDKPLTIGWSSIEHVQEITKGIDVLSFHHYKEIKALESPLKELKKNSDKPILISEYGKSSYQGIWGGGATEDEQKNHSFKMDVMTQNLKVGRMLWCLYDYESAPKEVFGWKPWMRAKQKHFGVVKVDGTRKLVAN